MDEQSKARDSLVSEKITQQKSETNPGCIVQKRSFTLLMIIIEILILLRFILNRNQTYYEKKKIVDLKIT